MNWLVKSKAAIEVQGITVAIVLSVLATARAETQEPKPDYSAPADAPYTAEDVAVKTPAGHTLAGTLHDPASTMRRVKTPVLILTGSRDQQAAPEQVVLMEAAFKESGDTDVTARVLPDLNHIFVHDTDGFPQNYAKLPPPVMMRADAVEMIADWLAHRLR